MAFTRDGYGQVEPNHLSAQRTAQIYAQLPAASTITELDNGQYVKYNYAANEVDYSTDVPEWMMVFNEVKLYDDKYRESYKDFAMLKDNCVDGVMVPRVIKTNVGDIYTTNMVATGDSVTYAVKDLLQPAAATGILTKATGALSTLTGMVWEVVALTTMPDDQDAVKLMRIQ